MRAAFLLVAVTVVGGCASPAGDDAAGDDDTPGAVDSGAGSGDAGGANDVDPELLNGTVPDSVLPAPEFVATNRDGSGRDREDLLGHPTVMWFYPAAATSG